MRNDVAQATNRQSRRLAAVQAPVIPIVGRWTAETPGTISLGQGVVSYEPPPQAIEAARRFGGKLTDHRYGPVEGLPELVAAIEAKLARENRMTVRPRSRVLVTAGGNQAFMNAVLAITDPDDEIVLLVPYYFNHEMAVVMAGAKAVAVPTTSEYQIVLRAIEDAITPRTRAVVTVSPNNPTGAVYPEADLRAVNALCRDRGLFHIHDEAYEYFTYGGVSHFSPGSLPDAAGHTISLFSLSKAYGMASWRIGYMVIPELLHEAVNKIQDTILICPPAVSQHAALAALEVGRAFAGAHLARLDATRRAIFEALSASGRAVRRSVARRRVLLPGARPLGARLDDAGRAPHPGASRRDDSGVGVRGSISLLDSDLLRCARLGVDHRRAAPVGRWSARAGVIGESSPSS